MNKRFLRSTMAILIGAALFLIGSGEVSTYTGTVRAVKGDKLSLLLKDGYEKTCKTDSRTQSFITGKLLPVNRIKPNSHVQVVVDHQDVCLQIVVEEGPK